MHPSSAFGLAETELPQPELLSHCLNLLEISVSQRQKGDAKGCTLCQPKAASPHESAVLGTRRCINGITLSSRNKPH